MADKEKGKVKASPEYFLQMAPNVLMDIIAKFEDIEHFKYFTISAIQHEKKKIQERFKDTHEKSREEIERYMDWYGEEYYMVEDIFSKISLNSFIIILYSYIESGLNSFSDALYYDESNKGNVQGGGPIQIRYTDIKGKGIDRAKVYLEKVFRVDLQAGKQPWQEIKALQKIRNVIVHEEGWASDDMPNDSCIRDCMEKGQVEIERRNDGSSGKVIVKPEYLDRILNQARLFFENIKLSDQ